MLEGEPASFLNSAGGRPSTGQTRRDPRAALGQQQQQVSAPAPPTGTHNGGLAEGDTAALAAQLAAGGDSALRLQQILANLPVVGTAEPKAFPLFCLQHSWGQHCTSPMQYQRFFANLPGMTSVTRAAFMEAVIA